MKKTLIYVGAHHGNSLSNFVSEYEQIYAFEANPRFCQILKQRFVANQNVTIINAAICEKHNTFITFNISKNNGDSSSILTPNVNNELFSCIQTSEQLTVPTINLFNFCQENNIQKIDTYISDLQGYDLIVLKTLEPYINKGLIDEIQCEVEKDNKPTIYNNEIVENQNKESNFNNILGEKYIKIAKGWGNLTDGVFEDVPEEWCEHDIKWTLKK
jgi:FkbM family methyltransferase